MNAFSDRRVLIGVGAGIVLLAVVLLAVFFRGQHGPVVSNQTAEADRLQLQMDKPDPKTAPKTQQIRCFVNGQLVGMATLSECAQKNGTASQALDVGLEAPPAAPGTATVTAPTLAAGLPAASNQTSECLRYGGDGWKGYGSNVGLGACVRVLFQGQCAKSGEAYYGRWGGESLRLIPGRVEISEDNKKFRLLVEQDADCSVASM
jgi:hypothetical protein